MKLENTLYCSKCQEVFNREECGHKCPACDNPGTYLLLALSKNDILSKEKFGIIKRVIIITLLTLASWGVVFLAFYGAVKLIELIF